MQNTNLELIIFSAVSGLVITSTIGFIVFVIFKYQKSHLQHLTEIETQKNEFEKTVLDVKLEIQEQTSHDIAREIHDSIGHGLTLAKLQLNTLLELPSETDFNKVRMAVDLLGQSIQQLSDISKNLNAEALLQQGLLPAIDEEISRLRTLNRFEVQYEVNGFTSYMESQQEIVIYRVIQEGFQNILKHSDARCAQLQLHFHPEYLHVSLIDDGNGFDPSTPKRTRSTGLSNIENRIRFLSGEFQIQSSLKKGTRIQFTIPYQANVKFN
jgi:signal transduction histidine kinase